jgi:aryl-alcohol dehydrogenase-like predicted oxidoreductase
MEMRTLGDTDLPVSVIGLGMAALGRPGYINLGHADDLEHTYDVDAMEQHAHHVLDVAYAGGVRYFDAARSYGKAERFLGRWLASREISAQEVTIGSKWGYTYTADWRVDAEVHEVKEHSLQVLERQWGETQSTLGSRLNLYQIHSATLESGVLERIDVLEALADLRQGGTFIGLTVSGPNQREVIERAIKTHVDGVRLFDTVQATWNLLEPSTTPALARAYAAGMGVIIKEALANGRLTPKNDNPDFHAQMAILQREADRLHTTIDALALAAVIDQPWVSLVLSGAAKETHLVSNLKAIDVAWDQQAAAALTDLVEPPEVYWHIRDQLPWN